MQRMKKPLSPMLVSMGLGVASLLGSQAVRAQVSCSANSIGALNFGVYAPLSSGPLTTTGTLNYTCSNTSAIYRYNVLACFSIGTGSAGSSLPTFSPHYLGNASNINQKLNFTINAPGGNSSWGSSFSSSFPPYQAPLLTVPVLTIFGAGQVSGSGSFTASVPGGQNTVTPGSYSSDYSGGHTALAWAWARSPNTPSDCFTAGPNGGTGYDGTSAFPFTASATVNPYCEITATTPLNFGTVDGLNTTTNTQSTLGVRCTNTTPHQIALQPSNGNASGNGVMKGVTPGNTDTIPYSLYKDATFNQPWGSTLGTTFGTGNTLWATGTGTAKNDIPIYGKVPNVIVLPDNYKDTVTVTITY